MSLWRSSCAMVADREYNHNDTKIWCEETLLGDGIDLLHSEMLEGFILYCDFTTISPGFQKGFNRILLGFY